MAGSVKYPFPSGCPERSNPVYRFFAPFRFPVWIALVTLSTYYVVPDETFLRIWRVPKLGNMEDVFYLLIAILAFAVGGLVGAALAIHRRISLVHVPTATSNNLPGWYLRAGLLTSLAGYVIWLGLAVYRAGGLSTLLAVRSVDPWYVKGVLMKTVPGVTTLTQVAVMAIPLWIAYGCRGKFERFLVWLIVLLAALRSYLFSERLALLEIIVPSLFLWLSNRKLTTSRAMGWLLASVAASFLFFALSESSRSFLARKIYSGTDLLQAAFYRFVGYYLTSVNNAILLLHTQDFAHPMYLTFSWLWHFPGLEGLYERVTGISVPSTPSLLAVSGLNPEFNTATAVGVWIADFGHVGALVWALIMGGISGFIWAMAPYDRMFAALCSVSIVGELELLRISYFTGTRVFPAFLFFLGALILRSAHRVRIRRDPH